MNIDFGPRVQGFMRFTFPLFLCYILQFRSSTLTLFQKQFIHNFLTNRYQKLFQAETLVDTRTNSSALKPLETMAEANPCKHVHPGSGRMHYLLLSLCGRCDFFSAPDHWSGLRGPWHQSLAATSIADI